MQKADHLPDGCNDDPGPAEAGLFKARYVVVICQGSGRLYRVHKHLILVVNRPMSVVGFLSGVLAKISIQATIPPH